MPSDFSTVAALDEILEDHIDQFAAWLNGDSNYAKVAAPIANDASNYLLALRNLGTGGKSLSWTSAAGTLKGTLNDNGLNIGASNWSTTGGINFPATFAIRFRNAANDADLDVVVGDGANNLVFGKITAVGSSYLAAFDAVYMYCQGEKFKATASGVAFNGASVGARPDYTVNNGSATRTIDVAAADLATTRAVVGTIIADLIAYGLFQ